MFEWFNVTICRQPSPQPTILLSGYTLVKGVWAGCVLYMVEHELDPKSRPINFGQKECSSRVIRAACWCFGPLGRRLIGLGPSSETCVRIHAVRSGSIFLHVHIRSVYSQWVWRPQDPQPLAMQFTGGDRCGDSPSMRLQSEVHFQCSASLGLVLESVHEMTTCFYRAVASTSLACVTIGSSPPPHSPVCQVSIARLDQRAGRLQSCVKALLDPRTQQNDSGVPEVCQGLTPNP